MNTLMIERNMMGMQGMGMPGAAQAAPSTGNMMMMPRCTMSFEKCNGGMKVTCVCEDKVSAGMLQNLCSMMAGGMCSFCNTMNGMMVCCCNMTMGMCSFEPTEMGVCMTCTSGDKNCCAMIQSCCECCSKMMAAGCACCMMMSNTPVCCAC